MKNKIVTLSIFILISFLFTYLSCETKTDDGDPANRDPVAPVLSFPENKAEDVEIDITLSWQISMDPDGDKVKYNVFLDTNASPAQIASAGQTATTYKPDINDNTTYYWKVEAIDENGGRAQSEIWSFTTLGSLPTAFSLISPTMSETCVALDAKLVWRSSTDPDGNDITYDVFFGTDNPPMSTVSTDQSDTTFLPALVDNTTYFWNIKAKNESGGVSQSGIWSFTTLKIPPVVEYGSFKDTRDNIEYKTVMIDGKTWMAQNLAYLPEELGPSELSDTDPRFYVYEYYGTSTSEAKATDNYGIYGVLYNLPAVLNGAAASSANPSGVQGVCPVGWHVPSKAEWIELDSYLRGEGFDEPALLLKAVCGWYDDGNGDDTFGLTILPGGALTPNFTQIGLRGYWWTTSDWYISMEYTHNGIRSDGKGHPRYGMSVRCVKD
jgi:uncharacterized protein (TIGR02145 family)